MAKDTDFPAVFAQLKALLEPYAPALLVKQNAPDNYYLNTRAAAPQRKELFFGAVQRKKSYISYHLMPVYMYPDLLDGISDQLKKRMQGKSCFNFRTVDHALLEELGALTARGFERLKHEDVIQKTS